MQNAPDNTPNLIVPGARRFGAVYCDYEFSGITAPAVVVTFADNWNFVFWEKSCYIPWWDLGGVGFTYEFLETASAECRGCCEPMSDKQCRYSRVRILESSPARVVVHWRYALCDVDYKIAFDEWADEYFTFYPDGLGVRKLVGHIRGDSWHEVMEFILLNPMGKGPADTVDLGRAVTWLNFAGERSVVSWPDAVFADEIRTWPDAVARIGIKERPDPFVVISEQRGLFPGGIRHDPWETTSADTDGSVPPSYSHWPICEELSWTTVASEPQDFARNVTHTCLHSIRARQTPPVGQDSIWYFLIGVAAPEIPDERLLEIGQGWVAGGAAESADSRLVSQGYDHGQKAFVFALAQPLASGESISFTISPITGTTLVNPAVVVSGWGEAAAQVQVDGAGIGCILTGHRPTLPGADLIIWLEADLGAPLAVRLTRL